MRFTNRLGGVLAATAVFMTATATVLPAQPALAVGCYGDYCSGKDPNATGCGADARTVASSDIKMAGGTLFGVHFGGGVVGKLELRWSDRCKTNWTRANVWESSQIAAIAAVQITGYSQWYNPTGSNMISTPPGVYWTKMIYSPNRPVQARATGAYLTSSCGTAWA